MHFYLVGGYDIRSLHAGMQLPRKAKARFIILLVLILVLIFCLTTSTPPSPSSTEPQKKVSSRAVDKELIDLKNFEMTIPPNACQKKKQDLKLLVIGVHSSRGNYNRRKAIRSTWGNIKTYKGWQLSVVFLLGSSPGPPQSHQENEVAELVKNETEIYKDMLIGSFVDVYRNLTYKHMMGYKWILDLCEKDAVDVYVKTDDDVFVNVFRLVEWTASHEIRAEFYCYILKGYSPWRSKKYKFYISKDEYKPSTLPDFCSGMGYITKPTVIRRLFEVSKRMKYLWVEDLFSTGLLVQRHNEEINNMMMTDSLEQQDSYISAQVALKDISDLYLNEQYSAYKQWIDDGTRAENPWIFILLDRRSEAMLLVEQKLLWTKTAIMYTVDNVHV